MNNYRFTDKQKVDIIQRYTVDLVPMITLAAEYGKTRQAVYKVLKAAGIDTSKAAANIAVSCCCCGQECTHKRYRVRNTIHLFCSQECYTAWLKHGNGNPLIIHRASSRRARAIVEKYFPLLPGYIVHHEDRNQFNNHPSNLRVFANQGDHIRYHRVPQLLVPILWDGRTVVGAR